MEWNVCFIINTSPLGVHMLGTFAHQKGAYSCGPRGKKQKVQVQSVKML